MVGRVAVGRPSASTEARKATAAVRVSLARATASRRSRSEGSVRAAVRGGKESAPREGVLG